MKKLVLLAIVFFALSGFAHSFWYLEDGDPNFTKTYDGKGTITFNHQAHAERINDCVVCHEALEINKGVVDRNFGHKTCGKCHKESKVETAPTRCNGCHIK